MSDLAGRVAMVTGGGSGIGRAVAVGFARAGAAVAVVDLDAAASTETARLVGDEGVDTLALAADVCDEARIEEVVAHVVEHWGRIDVACNNAGVAGTYAALADQTVADWDRTVAVNLTGVFLCLRAQAPRMAAAGRGAIVNVASDAGLMGFANLPAYVASKHGVVGLTRSVALEFATQGVRVNVVCPGTIRTPMLSGFVADDEAALEAMGRQTPMRRLGTPEEVAEAVVWLCSDRASYVTGQAVPVDGGVMAT